MYVTAKCNTGDGSRVGEARFKRFKVVNVVMYMLWTFFFYAVLDGGCMVLSYAACNDRSRSRTDAASEYGHAKF